jgi:aryl-alcohol dehydrogenase-like predicted oxidoreductase
MEKVEHIDEAVAATQLNLSAEEIESLESRYTPHLVMGHS